MAKMFMIWKQLLIFLFLPLHVLRSEPASGTVQGVTSALESLQPGNYDLEVKSPIFALTKSVRIEVFIPESLAQDRNRPLLVFFHGNSKDKKLYKTGNAFFKKKAEAHRFILISAQQWWSLSGGNMSGSHDTRKATNLVLHTLARKNLFDATQVYATGFSAGGFMAFLAVMDSLDHYANADHLKMTKFYRRQNAEAEGRVYNENEDVRAGVFRDFGGVEMNVFPYRGFGSFKGNFYNGVMGFPVEIEDWRAHYRLIFAGKKAYISVGGKKDAPRVRTQAPEMREFFENYLGLPCTYREYPEEGHSLTEKNWQDFWEMTGIR